jgi:phage terminase small subunit
MIVVGTPLVEAYELAGYSRDNRNAQALAARPHVQKRIKELRQGSVARTEITGARVINEAAKLAFFNLADFLDIHEDGTASVNLAKIDRDMAAAITEVVSRTVTRKNGDVVTTTNIKLADKKGPLELLAKYFGLLTEKLEVGRPGDFTAITSTEQLVEKLRKELGDADTDAFLQIVGKSKHGIDDAEVIEREGPSILEDSRDMQA